MFKDLTQEPGITQKEKALHEFKINPLKGGLAMLITGVVALLILVWVFDNNYRGFDDALMSTVYEETGMVERYHVEGRQSYIGFDDSIIDEVGSVIGFIVWGTLIFCGIGVIGTIYYSVLLGGAFRWNKIVRVIRDGKITPSVIAGNELTSDLVLLDEENRLISYAGREPFSLDKILDWSHEQYVETATYLAQGGGAVNTTKKEYFLYLDWEDENGNLQRVKVKFDGKETDVSQFLHRMKKAYDAG